MTAAAVAGGLSVNPATGERLQDAASSRKVALRAPHRVATPSATPHSQRTAQATQVAATLHLSSMRCTAPPSHAARHSSTTHHSLCGAWYRATRTPPLRASVPSPSAAGLASDRILSPPPPSPSG